jgi:pimeloyl-ACP methyl ester carboxylesterase
MTETSGFLDRPDGERLAWRRIAGAGPTVVWVGGWRSDMGGTKAEALAGAALAGGWSYLRYDHFAHGESSGDWLKATIGRWREDLIGLIDQIEGPVVLVGSSMGGWVSCLAGVARPGRVSAMVLIAPAADFAHRLMWPSLSDEARADIETAGVHTVTGDFDGPYDLTRTFFEEARNWSLLEGPVAITCPVRVLQGGAGRAGAVAARTGSGGKDRERGRGLLADQGRGSSPVEAAGHRQADRDRRRGARPRLGAISGARSRSCRGTTGRRECR